MEDISVVPAPPVDDFPMYSDYRPESLDNEVFVETEIAQLWGMHQCCASDIKSEQYRQRSVANSLGQLLHRMKAILATPGRCGKWSKWLKERQIPRASADRYVNRYAEAFHLSSELPHESIQHEPTEVEISKLFALIWPRCEKVLTTRRSRFEFLQCFLYRSGLTYDFTENGITVYEPDFEPAGVPEIVTPPQQTECAVAEYTEVL
jgi:hypothetical protein